VARIIDPVAGYLYELDSVQGIAHRVALKVMPAISGANLGVPFSRGADPNTTSESLGTESISGVTVVGTKETTIQPAGSNGNDRPLTSTHESWYSPRLGLVVYSRSSSQNVTSISTRNLEDLSTAEPDPALLKVPDGYIIVDETGAFTIRIPRPKAGRGPAQ
jgi:hypothetical protein